MHQNRNQESEHHSELLFHQYLFVIKPSEIRRLYSIDLLVFAVHIPDGRQGYLA